MIISNRPKLRNDGDNIFLNVISNNFEQEREVIKSVQLLKYNNVDDPKVNNSKQNNLKKFASNVTNINNFESIYSNQSYSDPNSPSWPYSGCSQINNNFKALDSTKTYFSNKDNNFLMNKFNSDSIIN